MESINYNYESLACRLLDNAFQRCLVRNFACTSSPRNVPLTQLAFVGPQLESCGSDVNAMFGHWLANLYEERVERWPTACVSRSCSAQRSFRVSRNSDKKCARAVAQAEMNPACLPR